MKPLEESSEYKQEMNGPLMCGLPDDITILCLARVPRWYHQTLKCVSRSWRALLCSEAWLSCRRKNNLQETWVYALCRHKLRGTCYYVLDPTRRCWKQLHVPQQCVNKVGFSSEALGYKFYLLGGCSWQKDATDEVYCYDALRNKWEIAPPLPKARSYFASTVIDDKLYVTGGHGGAYGVDSATRDSWDIYDLLSNSWTSRKNETNVPAYVVQCNIIDGKIYTIHMTENELEFVDRAGVYDPVSGTWQALEDEAAWIRRCCGRPTVTVDGENFYALQENLGTRLLMWNKESKNWVALGSLSVQLTRPPCRLVAVGRRIFLVGTGLNTMVVNVDQATENARMLVSSSIVTEFIPDLTIISCKTISL